MSSAIIGNLMAAYVIDSVQESIFYIVMTGLCFVATLWFLLVQPVTRKIKIEAAIGASTIVRDSVLEQQKSIK